MRMVQLLRMGRITPLILVITSNTRQDNSYSLPLREILHDTVQSWHIWSRRWRTLFVARWRTKKKVYRKERCIMQVAAIRYVQVWQWFSRHNLEVPYIRISTIRLSTVIILKFIQVLPPTTTNFICLLNKNSLLRAFAIFL